MNYDAMDLGNHEFNFGSDVFKGIMGQANFPVLGANVSDDGRYGLAAAQGGQGVKPYIEKTWAGIRSPCWASPTTAYPTMNCPATSSG